jgi:hypothetical protein
MQPDALPLGQVRHPGQAVSHLVGELGELVAEDFALRLKGQERRPPLASGLSGRGAHLAAGAAK